MTLDDCAAFAFVDLAFSTVLSIYGYERGMELPLPGSDEILLCSASTSCEEVMHYCSVNNFNCCTARVGDLSII